MGLLFNHIHLTLNFSLYKKPPQNKINQYVWWEALFTQAQIYSEPRGLEKYLLTENFSGLFEAAHPQNDITREVTKIAELVLLE